MTKLNDVQSCGIAIVGMACVYPGALNPEELWQNVLAGRRQFRKFPDERLPRDGYYDADPDAPGKSYSDQMAVITGWSFDPVKFRIPPVTFHTADIVHWLALHTAMEAIRDSGLDLKAADRSRFGVMLGNTLTGEFSRTSYLRFRWPYVQRAVRNALLQQGYGSHNIDALMEAIAHYFLSPLPELNEDTLAGNMSNTIAGRICGYFDLGGSGFTVDGACSSSLLAIAHACNALVSNDIDIALSGGVDVSLDPFEVVGFAKTKALAVDDVRPYDERAAGMLPGEGCGMFVLMREDKARAEGHPVHAVIQGWGYSSDGSGAITAPRVEGQMRAIAKTYERAGYAISEVGLFEGHGTGTTLGDKVEIEALRNLIDASSSAKQSWIGSIKGDIGHCKAASGAAGLIKAVMALKRKIIPPTGNCSLPNPVFGRPFGSLRPALFGQEWESGKGPRRAAVSAMGFGGANAHITIEEADRNGRASEADLGRLRSSRSSELILLSAVSSDDLAKKITAVMRTAERISRAELVDLAAALAREGHQGEYRLAILTDSPWHLAERLALVNSELVKGKGVNDIDAPDSGIFAGRTKRNPWFAALFPGQASQRINMGKDLLRAHQSIEDLTDAIESSIADIVPGGLKSRMFLDPYILDESAWKAKACELQDTCIAQPAIVMISLAAHKALSLHGLKPGLCLGHSLGEISALCAASALDELTAVKIAAIRGRIMSSLPAHRHGAMAAIAADHTAVAMLLEAHAPGLVISNYNSPRQTVVSGTVEDIEKIVAACRNKEIRAVRLPVSHAFHSKHVRPAAEEFRRALQSIQFRALTVNVISANTARVVEKGADLRQLLYEQIASPVRFMDAVLLAAEGLPDFWVEVGPGNVLSGLVRDILRDRDVECFSTDEQEQNNTTLLNRIFGRAFVRGCHLDTTSLFTERFTRPISAFDYNPLMIVNPCERPVQPLPRTAGNAERVLQDLAPVGADPDHFSSYLAQRRDFVREVIALDYRFFSDGTEHQTSMVASSATPVQPDQDVVQYALDWIAKRTGYPRESLTPTMKLREDLNLDSIKAGEFALILARKMKLASVPDAGSFANSSISSIIEYLRAGGDGTAVPALSLSGSTLPMDYAVGSLGDWNEAFQIRQVPLPRAADDQLPFEKTSAALVVAPSDDPRTESVLSLLDAAGLQATRIDYGTKAGTVEIPSGLSTVVIVLPEEKSDFLSSTQENFTLRVEGLASFLFSFFQLIVHAREDGLSGVRCIIARPYSVDADPGTDLDAGAGFLKTLKLEYPGFNAMWLCLPANWPAGQWGETIMQELQTKNARVWFRYADTGERLTDMAVPPDQLTAGSSLEASEGVMLVTGGAKGITFELASALARKTGIALGLLGTSPLPDRSFDKAGSELLSNLIRLEEAGIRYHYVSCNVTDREAIRSAIDDVQNSLGPVTMVLHGAGLTKPSPFLRMELKDYLDCIRVKTRGLYNLLSSIPACQLKALHVLSSVLGRTGMTGQIDYAFANAWLDGAVHAYLRKYPHVKGFSLGYSVWSDVGLGKRMDAASTLGAMGVVPVSTERGVAIYLDLALNGYQGTFIGTGRLGALDAGLYDLPHEKKGRFTERIMRSIPGTEIVTESHLTHAQDQYLPEHVFRGTALVPGVMGIEAMVSTAMLCAGSVRLPMLRNVRFHRPIIVPRDAVIAIRVMGIMKERKGDNLTLRMAVRSELDGYQESHFETDCVFGTDAPPAGLTLDIRSLPAAAPLTLGMFEPLPLFQGKLFRRIVAIHERTVGSRSITVIRVPEHASYFDKGTYNETATPPPAVRDSCLQSAGLILPEMCLPAGISRIVWHRDLKPGEELFCESRILNKADEGYLIHIGLFDSNGTLVEELQDVLFRTVQMGSISADAGLKQYPQISNNGTLFEQLFQDLPYAGVIAAYAGSEGPVPTRQPGTAGLHAGLKAAVHFARKRLGLQVASDLFTIENDQTGKPRLIIREKSLADAFAGIDISLSDSREFGLAVVGQPPLGVDIEPVEVRDAELWLGLLGEDGYDLARSISYEQQEPFDVSSTRVWTLIESGKKAMALKRVVPREDEPVPSGWLGFSADHNDVALHYYSTVMKMNDGMLAAITAAAADIRRSSQPATSAASQQSTANRLIQEEISRFLEGLERFSKICGSDPEHPDVEKHHASFHELYTLIPQRLHSISLELQPDMQRAYQGDLAGKLLRYIKGEVDSVSFRRALEKPLGYPGDYLLMDMMLKQEIKTYGIGYHFDRKFIEYPGSEGVRQRTYWVVDRLQKLLAAKQDSSLTVLDLGCGPMTIEKMLAEGAGPDVRFTFLGLDMDPQATSYARFRIHHSNCSVEIRTCNLLGNDGMRNIREFAPKADVCVCMGFFDYLDSETIAVFLEAVHSHVRDGTPVLFANYQPDHPARLAMEWLLDWWLVYKTENEIRSIAEKANFPPDRIWTGLDSSGCIVLVEARK